MNDPGATPILCRPALPLDREPVMDFLQEIWSGEDYVPMVWDDWLWREPGLLAVALRSGMVVGQGHLLDMGQGEWWLEGLRVRPSDQGQGVGSHLHDYFVERWLSTAGDVVRLATHTNRTSVHKMCERTEFDRLFEIGLMKAETAGGDSAEAMVAREMSAEAIYAWANQSDQTELQGGLADYGWRYATPGAERYSSLEGVVALQGAGGSGALVQPAGQHREAAQLLALHGGQGSPAEAAAAVLAWAGQSGQPGVAWLVPAPWWDQAKTAGFDPDEDSRLYIYERHR